MQFAIGLLVVLAAVCALGSFITQGQTYDAYAQLYGERTAGAIMALQLDDVFHAWWFVLLTTFLCVNLILCNLVRIPAILKQQKREGDPASAFGKEGTVCVRGVKDPEGLFRALGFRGIRKTEQGLFAVKNRVTERSFLKLKLPTRESVSDLRIKKNCSLNSSVLRWKETVRLKERGLDLSLHNVFLI